MECKKLWFHLFFTLYLAKFLVLSINYQEKYILSVNVIKISMAPIGGTTMWLKILILKLSDN